MYRRYRYENHVRYALYAIIFGITWVLGLAAAVLAVEEGRPSVTAQSVCAFRAIAAHDPDPKVRNPDHMAEKMLGRQYWDNSGLNPFLQRMKAGQRPITLPTMHWVTARTHHVDSVLKQAVNEGARQVVILGAGYDSRAYRFRKAMPRVTFFEVDFPATLEDKLRRLKKILGAVPNWVHYAPIDFTKQTLGSVLDRAGYRRDVKTFFVWEGVTCYLDEASVKSTLKFIARGSAPGSQVFFDYMYQSVIEGDYRYPYSQSLAERVRSVGEPWTYGLKPYGTDLLLRECGLSLISDLGPKEFAQKYLVGSDGRPIGEPLQFLSLALAQVPTKK